MYRYTHTSHFPKGWLSEHIVKLFESADQCVHDFLSQVILADWHFLGKLSIILRGAPVSASFVSLQSLRKKFSEHIFSQKSQQSHIIMVHLSKCWYTNFLFNHCSRPTRQNPTSLNNLLKVCNNFGRHTIVSLSPLKSKYFEHASPSQ